MTFLKAIYIDNEPESFYTVCISFPIFKNKESQTYSPRLVTPTANKWPLYKVWTFQYAMGRVWIFVKKSDQNTRTTDQWSWYLSSCMNPVETSFQQ